jgi:hypothetical protein
MINKRTVFVLLITLLAGTVAYADGGETLQRLIDGGGTAAASTDSQGPDAASETADDGSIRITPDTTKIVRLDQDAASVIVANPAHASIALDSPRLLVVMPRMPGTTSFTVLNNRGEVIMEKNVIVAAAAKPKYVRVRRACRAGDETCVPSAYYYCPDGCYEVTPVQPADGPAEAPPVMSGAGAAAALPAAAPMAVPQTPPPPQAVAPDEPEREEE